MIRLFSRKLPIEPKYSYTYTPTSYRITVNERLANLQTPEIYGLPEGDFEPISIIIPFRSSGARLNNLYSVLKTLQHSQIEVIVVEGDTETKMDFTDFPDIKHVLVPIEGPFNKSICFNAGAMEASYDKLLFHDADLLMTKDYICDVSNQLEVNDACHLGRTVYYLSDKDTSIYNKTCILTTEMQIPRTVNYFEGGSVGCNFNAFVSVGGFNEEFVGYGVEDCDFYARLKSVQFNTDRNYSFLHLNHGREDGWDAQHNANKSRALINSTFDSEEYILSLREKLTSKYNLEIK